MHGVLAGCNVDFAAPQCGNVINGGLERSIVCSKNVGVCLPCGDTNLAAHWMVVHIGLPQVVWHKRLDGVFFVLLSYNIFSGLDNQNLVRVVSPVRRKGLEDAYDGRM